MSQNNKKVSGKILGGIIKIEIFTFSDFAQDNNGKLTIVGTFDTIIARSFPCVHPQLSIAIRMRFELWEFTKHTFRIEVNDLDGETVMEPIKGYIDIKESGNATSFTDLVFTISNMHFNNPGIINFVIYLDDKEAGYIPLYIRKG